MFWASLEFPTQHRMTSSLVFWSSYLHLWSAGMTGVWLRSKPRTLLLHIRRALYQQRHIPLTLENTFIKAVLNIIIKHHFYFINEESCSETLHNLPEVTQLVSGMTWFPSHICPTPDNTSKCYFFSNTV